MRVIGARAGAIRRGVVGEVVSVGVSSAVVALVPNFEHLMRQIHGG